MCEGCGLSERQSAARGDREPRTAPPSGLGGGGIPPPEDPPRRLRGVVVKGGLGELTKGWDSSELALDDATDVRRLPFASKLPGLRLTLLGPRILRSGAYSHFKPRRRQRSQIGCSPLHCGREESVNNKPPYTRMVTYLSLPSATLVARLSSANPRVLRGCLVDTGRWVKRARHRPRWRRRRRLHGAGRDCVLLSDHV